MSSLRTPSALRAGHWSLGKSPSQGFQLIFLLYDPSFGFCFRYCQIYLQAILLQCQISLIVHQTHHSRHTLIFTINSPRVVALIICTSTYYIDTHNSHTVIECKHFGLHFHYINHDCPKHPSQWLSFSYLGFLSYSPYVLYFYSLN